MLKSVSVLAVLASMGFFASCLYNASSSQSAVSNNKNDGKSATNYASYCAGCHGEKMDAFVDRKWKHGNTEADLFKAIKVGYHDEGMPGFDSTFTDDEIKDLVDYIVTGIQNVKQYSFTDSVKSNIFETGSLTIQLDTIIKGIEVPWGMAFLPGGEMLVTERGGKMYRVAKNKSVQEITGVPEVIAQGQGGLMDVELHPDFNNNQVIYISYSIGKNTDSGLLSSTAIAKAVLSGNALSAVTNIFEALPYSKTRHHYGSRLEFGKDGYLYFTVGDRGNHHQNPQSLNTHAGKTHRIKDDGGIPNDNPFVNISGAMPSIYSYGHRNQQGLVIHPKTGVIWSHEHGPRGGDEINIVEKGKNYGWPATSYGINYNGTVLTEKTKMEGMEEPLLYWLPSIGPSGLAFVKGSRYKGWEDALLVGSLRFKYLNLCTIKGNKVVNQEMLFKNIGRVRDVEMGPDGFIYVSVEKPGAVFRLVPIENK